MLEHAEVSIEEANALSESAALALVDRETTDVIKVLKWLEETWAEELLPYDRVRLATTLAEISKALGIDHAGLIAAVAADTEEGKGSVALNLSPYSATIKALATHKAEAVKSFLQRPKVWPNKRLLILPEIELDPAILRNARRDRYVMVGRL